METLANDFRARWRAFKARAQNTWLWRVFGVCAMKKLWTKFLVAVAIAAGYWGLFFGIEWLNPVYPLEQLNRTDGILVYVYQPLRSAHGAKIRIRTDTGDEITFRGSMYDDERVRLLAVKGKQVTVWNHTYYSAWPPIHYERFWQIQEGAHVLVSYEDSYKGGLHDRPGYAWLSKFLLALTILSLVIVTLACRKGSPAE